MEREREKRREQERGRELRGKGIPGSIKAFQC